MEENEEDYDNFAFPLGAGFTNDRANGLTKREYFAGLAMQGILANPHDIATIHKEVKATNSLSNAVARSACIFADELLAELAKERTE